MISTAEQSDLARCTDTANAMLTNGRSLSTDIDDMLDNAGQMRIDDIEVSDEEIVALFVTEFGGTREAAIERLARFDAKQFSVTTEE